MSDILTDLDDLRNSILTVPTQRNVQDVVAMMRRIMLVQLTHARAPSELLYETIGETYSPEPDGVLAARDDLSIPFEMTGEHHPDGAPVIDPDWPRRELPPPPPPPSEE